MNKFESYKHYQKIFWGIKEGEGFEKGYYHGFDAAKQEIFNILNSLHSAPNTKISLNEIIALMKEKL